MYARRREYLYLGGMLSSAISLMAVLSIANIFLRAETLFLVQLYGGLMVFSGYIVYDTQLMVEKAHAGQYDVAEHALQLWLDFVAVFVRVLIILLRNAEKKSRENNDNRNRSSNRR
jgi:FtsH-binding integral membrane protein